MTMFFRLLEENKIEQIVDTVFFISDFENSINLMQAPDNFLLQNDLCHKIINLLQALQNKKLELSNDISNILDELHPDYEKVNALRALKQKFESVIGKTIVLIEDIFNINNDFSIQFLDIMKNKDGDFFLRNLRIIEKLITVTKSDLEFKEFLTTDEIRRAYLLSASQGLPVLVSRLNFYIHHSESDCYNAVVSAASNGHVRVVDMLYSYINVPEESINAAFREASKNGHLEMVKYLLKLSKDFEEYDGYEKTFDINSVDNRGYSAIILAVLNEQLEMVKYLHEEAKVKLVEGQDDTLLLPYQYKYKDHKIIKDLGLKFKKDKDLTASRKTLKQNKQSCSTDIQPSTLLSQPLPSSLHRCSTNLQTHKRGNGGAAMASAGSNKKEKENVTYTLSSNFLARVLLSSPEFHIPIPSTAQMPGAGGAAAAAPAAQAQAQAKETKEDNSAKRNTPYFTSIQQLKI